MEKQEIRAKQRARRLALQAIYQWLMTHEEAHVIEAQFRATQDNGQIDMAYFSRLLQGVLTQCDGLEEQFSPFLDRNVAQLNPIERVVLLLGTYELQTCLEVPYRIVLDEAVTMAKSFGSQDGHRYVNGVLNNVAKTLRTLETSASQ